MEQMNQTLVGFSNKINDPTLKSRLKKNSKGTFIFALILILLPIAVTFFIGIKNDDFKVLPLGFIVSSIILIFNLISLSKKKSEKQWDGVVIDKKIKEKTERDPEYQGRKTYTEYTVLLRDEKNKTRKISEGTPTTSSHPYYEYLNIGDKVRYHPQFNNFYEKYDKTNDTYLYCAICSKKNDITEEHCTFCNELLIK